MVRLVIVVFLLLTVIIIQLHLIRLKSMENEAREKIVEEMEAIYRKNRLLYCKELVSAFRCYCPKLTK